MMAGKLPSVMTIDELAEYVRIPKQTLYKLAQEKRIPGQKVGRSWRFRKEAIDRWLDEQYEQEYEQTNRKRGR